MLVDRHQSSWKVQFVHRDFFYFLCFKPRKLIEMDAILKRLNQVAGATSEKSIIKARDLERDKPYAILDLKKVHVKYGTQKVDKILATVEGVIFLPEEV